MRFDRKFQVRTNATLVEQWADEAEASGMDIATWIRRCLDYCRTEGIRFGETITRKRKGRKQRWH